MQLWHLKNVRLNIFEMWQDANTPILAEYLRWTIFSTELIFILAARIVRDALSNFSFAQISYTPFIFEGQERK